MLPRSTGIAKKSLRGVPEIFFVFIEINVGVLVPVVFGLGYCDEKPVART